MNAKQRRKFTRNHIGEARIELASAILLGRVSRDSNYSIALRSKSASARLDAIRRFIKDRKYMARRGLVWQ